MTIVSFDYAAFVTRYPEFSTLDAGLAAAYFAEAGIYLDNTDCSPVQDVTVRALLLNMLVAHIATINAPVAAGGSGSSLVGRISSASEGTVSVATEYSSDTSNVTAWLNQTKYGAAYVAATARFRRFFYAPGRSHAAGLPLWRR